jgi:RNA polymerase sigma factor (sigma-70 family)
MPELNVKKFDGSPSEANLKIRREKLEYTVEQFRPNLLMDIQVYLKQFKLFHLLEQTEDFWSELKITAIRNANNYDPECSARAWLRQAAFYMIQRLSRDEKKHPQITQISEAALKFGFDGNTDETSETELLDYLRQKSVDRLFKENQLKADEILSVVDESDRRILRMSFVDGYSNREIAAHLGISEGAAHVRLSRARNRLRKEFLKQ